MINISVLSTLLITTESWKQTMTKLTASCLNLKRSNETKTSFLFFHIVTHSKITLSWHRVNRTNNLYKKQGKKSTVERTVFCVTCIWHYFLVLLASSNVTWNAANNERYVTINNKYLLKYVLWWNYLYLLLTLLTIFSIENSN